jgi:hypothetical protein
MPGSRKTASKGPERIRKNMDIDAKKLSAARRILGAESDTATIDQALDDVIFVHELRSAMDALVAAGPLSVDPAQYAKAPRSRRIAER